MRRLVRLAICGGTARTPRSSRPRPVAVPRSHSSSPQRCGRRTSAPPRRALSSTTCKPDASSSRSMPDWHFIRRRTRSSATTFARPRCPRPVVPDRDGRARRRDAERDDVAGRHRPQGLRRPDPLRGRSVVARTPGRARRHQTRARAGDRRRVVVRRAPRRRRLETRRSTSTSPRRSRHSSSIAAGTDARRRSPPSTRRSSFAAYLVDAGVSVSWAGADRRRARRRSRTRLRRLAAALLTHPLHGHGERQLHGRDAAEAGRRSAARRGDGGRRGCGDAPASLRRPACSLRGDPDRRRLRPLAHRPLDADGPRRRPPPDVARSRPPPVHHGVAAGRRRERDARLPDAERPRVPVRPREDGHDRQRVGAVGLRRRPLRLLRRREREPGRTSAAAQRTQDAFAEVLARAAKSG